VLDFYQNMPYYVSEFNMKLNTNKEKEMNHQVNVSSEQFDRFQGFLNDCGLELSDEQLDEAWDDLVEYEEQEKERMLFDTFMERLRIRL